MEMDHIIKKAEGISEWAVSVSMHFTNISIFYLQILIVLELAAYIILFWHLHKYNQNLKTDGSTLRISHDTLNRRKRRNIVTFVGQFASFIIEIIVTIILQLLVVFNGNNAGNGLVPALAITTSAILTITFFVASPELKKFYFRF